MFQLNGFIEVIKDAQQVSDRFRKREFVVRTEGQYPQYVLFQAVQDRVDLLSSFRAGDAVTVNFDVRGRKWDSPNGEVKFFTTLDAYRISAGQGNPVPAHSGAPAASNPAPAPVSYSSQETPESDDLPF